MTANVEGETLIGIEWTLVVVALGFIALREYARLNLKGTIISWNDFFAVFAWIAFVAETSLDTVLWKENWFADLTSVTETASGQVNTVLALKVIYVECTTYYLCMYSVKASMLCFYTELVPLTMKKTRILTWVSVGTVAVGFLATMLVGFLICQPVSLNWELDPEKACNVGWTPAGNVIPYFFHLVTDIMIYAIPIPVVRAVKLPKKQKIGVGITFGLGFVCTLFACSVIITSWVNSSSAGLLWLFAALEQTWAVMIVSAPAFKYFITMNDHGSSLVERIGGTWKSKQSSSSGGNDSRSTPRKTNHWIMLSGNKLETNKGPSYHSRTEDSDAIAFVDLRSPTTISHSEEDAQYEKTSPSSSEQKINAIVKSVDIEVCSSSRVDIQRTDDADLERGPQFSVHPSERMDL